MRKLKGSVVFVCAGGDDDLSKKVQSQIEVDFTGVVGDHHAGPSRAAYSGDREPRGTLLRNDRQWSGVSVEELAEISTRLNLTEPITASTLGANLCFEGIPDFSLLPRGSRLKFASGAALTVEEYNPPCLDMGRQVTQKHSTRSGDPLKPNQWLKPAAGRRGLVGVVDVPGIIKPGDEVIIEVFEEPVIRRY